MNYPAWQLKKGDPAAEKAEEMRNRGYQIAKLGGRNVWVDKNGDFIEEVRE